MHRPVGDLPGPLVLLGDEDAPAGPAERELVREAGGEILLLPTAAAYERPDRALRRAADRFGPEGHVRACPVLRRQDAEAPALAAEVAAARFLHLSGASPLHLRSVLKDSPVLQGLLQAWRTGAVLSGAGPAATVLSDPMVDPRGGAFTVGLGLVRDLAVVCGGELDDTQLRRTLALAPPSCAVVALGPGAALWRLPDGTWRREGEGSVDIYLHAAPVGLEALAGKRLHPALDRAGTPGQVSGPSAST